MNYFPFHIGDWMSHTSHLSPEEKAAYLAMIIEEYLHEKPLPDDVEQIARKINMRTHCDCIAVVLQEFYERIAGDEGGWSNKRVREEILAYKAKSEKARQSANARWNKGKTANNANALQTQSERNANHKPITNNQSNRAFAPPTVKEVRNYCQERRNTVDPDRFVDFYSAKGWMVGKNKMRDWKAAVRTWEKDASNKNNDYTSGVI